MSPALKRENFEIIKIGGDVYTRELFGKDALKIVKELDPTGKNIYLMQTTLMRKTEGKRFYI